MMLFTNMRTIITVATTVPHNAMARREIQSLEKIDRTRAYARTPREYTKAELDRLFETVEIATANHAAIDLNSIEDVLLTGDFSLTSLGASSSIWISMSRPMMRK